MPDTAFIITVDAEGDNVWAKPRVATTRNAECLPRFQALCEKFDFRPVYLANYEMARSACFVGFARDVLARDAGEVGMHLHAWNTPPFAPLTGDDCAFQPYLIEYPDDVLRAKVRTLTDLLEDRFERKMLSHRAGRWGFDERYAAALLDTGYRIDCSVTPGVDWGGNLGDPGGNGGPDYRGFPQTPYYLNPADISAPGSDGLLEVPVTIRPSPLMRCADWAYRVPVLRSAANRLSPGLRWLSPAESSLSQMRAAARQAREEGAGHIEFMLHSSELMPGGSPFFRDAAAIERLYEDMETLFAELATWCRGMTLQEFATRHAGHGATLQ
jgi:hypothetical protein